MSVYPIAIVAGDFNDDGNLDLATADANGTETDDYSIYLGNGDGTFQAPMPYAVGGAGFSTAIVTGDFTGNRPDRPGDRPDRSRRRPRAALATATARSPTRPMVDLVSRDTPLVADLNGDGVPDVSVVDSAGDILFRAGQPGEPGSFAPPITVNPGDPSRDIAFVDTRPWAR